MTGVRAARPSTARLLPLVYAAVAGSLLLPIVALRFAARLGWPQAAATVGAVGLGGGLAALLLRRQRVRGASPPVAAVAAGRVAAGRVAAGLWSRRGHALEVCASFLVPLGLYLAGASLLAF